MVPDLAAPRGFVSVGPCSPACVKCQLACKPGSVWRLPSATAIHLGLGSLPASSNQPGRRPGSRLVAGVASAPAPPLFGLAPGGVCRAASVAGDAVRSYRTLSPLPLRGRPRAGGLLSVALSLGSPPAAVSRHRRSLEPGLSSTGRVWPRSLIARQRPSGQLAVAIRGPAGVRSR